MPFGFFSKKKKEENKEKESASTTSHSQEKVSKSGKDNIVVDQCWSLTTHHGNAIAFDPQRGLFALADQSAIHVFGQDGLTVTLNLPRIKDTIDRILFIVSDDGGIAAIGNGGTTFYLFDLGTKGIMLEEDMEPDSHLVAFHHPVGSNWLYLGLTTPTMSDKVLVVNLEYALVGGHEIHIEMGRIGGLLTYPEDETLLLIRPQNQTHIIQMDVLTNSVHSLYTCEQGGVPEAFCITGDGKWLVAIVNGDVYAWRVQPRDKAKDKQNQATGKPPVYMAELHSPFCSRSKGDVALPCKLEFASWKPDTHEYSLLGFNHIYGIFVITIKREHHKLSVSNIRSIVDVQTLPSPDALVDLCPLPLDSAWMLERQHFTNFAYLLRNGEVRLFDVEFHQKTAVTTSTDSDNVLPYLDVNYSHSYICDDISQYYIVPYDFGQTPDTDKSSSNSSAVHPKWPLVGGHSPLHGNNLLTRVDLIVYINEQKHKLQFLKTVLDHSIVWPVQIPMLELLDGVCAIHPCYSLRGLVCVCVEQEGTVLSVYLVMPGTGTRRLIWDVKAQQQLTVKPTTPSPPPAEKSTSDKRDNAVQQPEQQQSPTSAVSDGSSFSEVNAEEIAAALKLEAFGGSTSTSTSSSTSSSSSASPPAPLPSAPSTHSFSSTSFNSALSKHTSGQYRDKAYERVFNSTDQSDFNTDWKLVEKGIGLSPYKEYTLAEFKEALNMGSELVEPINVICTTLLNQIEDLFGGHAAVTTAVTANTSPPPPPSPSPPTPTVPPTTTSTTSTTSPTSTTTQPQQQPSPQIQPQKPPKPSEVSPPPTTTTSSSTSSTPTASTEDTKTTPTAEQGFLCNEIASLRCSEILGVVLLGYKNGDICIINTTYETQQTVNIYDLKTASLLSKNAANGKERPFNMSSVELITLHKKEHVASNDRQFSIVCSTVDGSIHLLYLPHYVQPQRTSDNLLQRPLHVNYNDMQVNRKYCGDKHPQLNANTKLICCNAAEQRKMLEPSLPDMQSLKNKKRLEFNRNTDMLPPIIIPSDFSLAFILDKQTILFGAATNSQWRCEVVGVMGKVIVGVVLQIGKVQKGCDSTTTTLHKVHVYHNRKYDGHFDVSVDISTEGLDEYEDEDELNLAVCHDDSIGMYIISIGDKNLYSQPYDVHQQQQQDTSTRQTHKSTKGGFPVVGVRLQQEGYGGDSKMESVNADEIIKKVEIGDSLLVGEDSISCVYKRNVLNDDQQDKPLTPHQMYLSPTLVFSHNNNIKLLSVTKEGAINESSSTTIGDCQSIVDIGIMSCNGSQPYIIALLDNGIHSIRCISNLKEVHRVQHFSGPYKTLAFIGQSLGGTTTAHAFCALAKQGGGTFIQSGRFRVGEEIEGEALHTCKLVQSSSSALYAYEGGGSSTSGGGATLGAQPIRKKGFFKRKSTTAPDPADVKAILGKSKRAVQRNIQAMNEEEKRGELFGEDSDDEEGGGEEKHERFKGGDTKSDIADTKELMNENIRRLHERGEKLGKVQDKSSDLADAAKNFGALATELRKQKKRGLF